MLVIEVCFTEDIWDYWLYCDLQHIFS